MSVGTAIDCRGKRLRTHYCTWFRFFVVSTWRSRFYYGCQACEEYTARLSWLSFCLESGARLTTVIFEMRSALSMRRIIRMFANADVCNQLGASANSCAVPKRLRASAFYCRQCCATQTTGKSRSFCLAPNTGRTALFSGFAPPTVQYGPLFPCPPVSTPSSEESFPAWWRSGGDSGQQSTTGWEGSLGTMAAPSTRLSSNLGIAQQGHRSSQRGHLS